MKKLVIASAIALMASTASALDLSVSQTRDFGRVERNGVGLAVGHNVGPVHLGLGVERFTKGTNDLDRYSLVASYDVLKTKVGSVAVKAGGAYLNNERGSDGFAAVAGLGYRFPVTKTVSVGVDVVRQFGQERVSAQDGNRATAVVTLKF